MTDMAELQRRKKLINLAIVYVDPDAFIANYVPWLEITTFITALRAGDVQAPADGVTPTLTPQQMKGGVAASYGNDAVFAFCMTAALKGDKAAVDKVEAALAESLGKDFPGSVAFWNFRSANDSPMSLEDHVGAAAYKMLGGDIPPPPMRARENWNAGLRFFEKARQSNFVQEIMYPLAVWTRTKWSETLEKGVSFLAHIEDSVPVLQEALADSRNDQAFIANMLLKMAPAIEQDLSDDTQGFLRSLARRA
ncbi:hypothetical protein OGR47_03950 [Methylocystis sp. MJC1]|uniref:hypothetical protein n=1 Tax=Methylocystis sp. MJC1 TaxID=2654282 RepID=UPI0013EDD700|nr:hypothetical protein [Methylocystis sp. MJC1]KAF2991291.1 hypothetical protein MJC1_01640 [Methylocystis sp. MJC1]MBU6526169.1 hypothetical protein [Methylocystis sp. MJC1]UZX12623.1 hypothetical protein OGR47_03950 [Methylocystis sp. MJC1]